MARLDLEAIGVETHAGGAVVSDFRMTDTELNGMSAGRATISLAGT